MMRSSKLLVGLAIGLLMITKCESAPTRRTIVQGTFENGHLQLVEGDGRAPRQKAPLGKPIYDGDAGLEFEGVYFHEDVVLGTGVELGTGSKLYNDVQMGDNSKLLGAVIVDYGARIGKRSELGDGTNVDMEATIGDGVTIGERVTIRYKVTLQNNVTVGDGVTLGHDALVKANVTIGPGAVVDSNVTVTQDVAAGEHVIAARRTRRSQSPKIFHSTIFRGDGMALVIKHPEDAERAQVVRYAKTVNINQVGGNRIFLDLPEQYYR